MFTTYTYQAGSTKANVLADIVLLLTGTTDKALLSGDCVQGSTEILSTVAAGWSVYDSIAGTNAQCLRAANLAAAPYKYIVVDTNTANVVFLKVYRSWDSGAHTGTNLAWKSDDAAIAGTRLDLTNGGILYVGASARYVVIFSLVSGQWGVNTAGVYCPVMCVERTCAGAWDTVGADYPPYVFGALYAMASSYTGWIVDGGSMMGMYAPIMKGLSGDLTTENAFLTCTTEFGAGAINNTTGSFKAQLPTARGFDGSLTLKHFMHEITLVRKQHAWKAGKLYALKMTTTDYGSAGDTISFGGSVYFIMTEGQSTGTGAGGRLAVPKF